MAAKAFLIGLLFVTSPSPTGLPAQDRECTKRTVPVGVVDLTGISLGASARQDTEDAGAEGGGLGRAWLGVTSRFQGLPEERKGFLDPGRCPISVN